MKKFKILSLLLGITILASCGDGHSGDRYEGVWRIADLHSTSVHCGLTADPFDGDQTLTRAGTEYTLTLKNNSALSGNLTEVAADANPCITFESGPDTVVYSSFENDTAHVTLQRSVVLNSAVGPILCLQTWEGSAHRL